MRPYLILWYLVALELAVCGLVLDVGELAITGEVGLFVWLYYARKEK